LKELDELSRRRAQLLLNGKVGARQILMLDAAFELITRAQEAKKAGWTDLQEQLDRFANDLSAKAWSEVDGEKAGSTEGARQVTQRQDTHRQDTH
jgi:hypothetical protein